ncbi:MAG: HTTM domain-containing protein [Leptospiraceae bacterium]|nr:HTTM domain-containing protein [Leptospiraceae bacterium]
MNYIKKRVPIFPILYFRIVLGLLLIQLLIRYFYYDWIRKYFTLPIFYFPHFNWDWLHPLPGNGMYFLFFILLLLAIFILHGVKTRLSAFLFAIGFAYQHLIDKSNFLNHYYLIFLLCIILALIPIPDSKEITKVMRIPRWALWLVRFQLGVVYTFGAIAKMRPDWVFDAMPLKIWLLMNRDMPILGELLVWNITPYFFSYAGLLFDLFIFPFLLIPKTRKFAYSIVLFFHIITFLLFPIGMFPWIMVFLTPVCFSNRFHYRFITLIRKIFIFRLFNRKLIPYTIFKYSNISKSSVPLRLCDKSISANFYLTIIFCILQVLLPFRHFLFPGNLLWTEEGFRFSWHIMAAHKSGLVTFYIKEKDKEKFPVSYNNILTQRQLGQMTTDPAMIWQFANFIYNQEEKKGRKNFGIYAEAYVSLNGKPAILMIDPDMDLHSVYYDYFSHTEWIK